MYQMARFVLLASIMIAVTAGTASADLVGHWKLDDAAGDIATDTLGNGNDGTFIGDPQWVTGMLGGAIELDGDDHITIPDYDALHSDQYSAAAWVNIPVEQAGNYSTWVVTKGVVGGAGGYGLAIQGQEPTVYQEDGNTWHRIFSGVEIALDEWHHIAATYDETSIAIYVDGVLGNTEEFGFAISPIDLMIGAWRATSPTRFYTGVVDDVRIYDHTLSEAEVRGAMTGKPWPYAFGPDPVDGAMHEGVWVTLSWSSGQLAFSHDVYFGDDFNDVNDATTASEAYRDSQGREETSFDPGRLEFNTTYFWRIDEVNAEPNSFAYKGDVWSFTIPNFLVVDDFESYNDTDNAVYDTWQDGWNDDDNGAVVGYSDPVIDQGQHYQETVIIHGGKQSMPFFYYTDGTKISELSLPLEGPDRDLTRDGVVDLGLWFKGFPYTALGSAIEAPAGTFTVRGAGEDIYGDHDQFQFVYKEITGAATIIAKVESLENDPGDPNTDPWAKAGIMIRNTLEGDSTYGSMLLSKGNGMRNQYRPFEGGESLRVFDPNLVPPYWVKMERTIAGLTRFYLSTDGVEWTNKTSEWGSATSFGLKFLSMQNPIYVGMAVTSHLEGVPTEAVFSNVTITGNGSDGPWLNQDVGFFINGAEPLYVGVDDAVVYHEDPAATLIEEWTAWRIPLQDFVDQGVDLTDASRIRIGIGIPGDIIRSGSEGQVFIDDIRLYLP
ncbi:LamG domain-containing protein [Planctomycetota bacterium]